jgi:hypothetical protein
VADDEALRVRDAANSSVTVAASPAPHLEKVRRYVIKRHTDWAIDDVVALRTR